MDIINDGVLWQHIIQRIRDRDVVMPNFEMWTDGDVLLVSTEEAANCIADFLTAIGFDCLTGYYDPVEDRISRLVDDHTGWYYIDVQ